MQTQPQTLKHDAAEKVAYCPSDNDASESRVQAEFLRIKIRSWPSLLPLNHSPLPGKYNVTETQSKLTGAAKWTLPLSEDRSILSVQLMSCSRLLGERVPTFINEHVLLLCLFFFLTKRLSMSKKKKAIHTGCALYTAWPKKNGCCLDLIRTNT